ncbi:MAG: molybdate ABC transporter substrate-binding protein [Gemmatimonadetes bacterium]|nr:molybdate ABC transporter substrate-binding protein [Gemmatimonadota bacterium]
MLPIAVPSHAEPVTVFAAASLSGALSEFWPRARHPDISLSFAGSSVLARQIEAGAPADLFLSANSAWMDYLQTRGHVDSTTRLDLLGNRLVMIAPRGEGFTLTLESQADMGGAFSGRLALGDPSHVPAGIYAQQALQALGWWPALAARLAPARDVRSAVAWVERGECAAGIAYASDVVSSPGVELVASFPDSLHAPIRYPAALVSGRSATTSRRYLDTLRSAAARAVFRRHGFLLLTDLE